MSKTTHKRQSYIYEDVARIGAWVLPSGNIVEANLSYCPKAEPGKEYIVSYDIGEQFPFVKSDLRVFADRVRPQACQRATAFQSELALFRDGKKRRNN